MSLRERSPKIFSSGLQSMMSLLQSNTKKHEFFNPSAKACASPSIVCHPVGKQNGLSSSQMQCFCSSQNPIPALDQSVTKHVGLDTLNILTLSSISLTICSLDRWKSFSSSSFHEKGLRSWQNGSMWSAQAKAHDTWLTRPNQELSVMLQSQDMVRGQTFSILAGAWVSSSRCSPVTVHLEECLHSCIPEMDSQFMGMVRQKKKEGSFTFKVPETKGA